MFESPLSRRLDGDTVMPCPPGFPIDFVGKMLRACSGFAALPAENVTCCCHLGFIPVAAYTVLPAELSFCTLSKKFFYSLFHSFKRI
jgi:hypothetical protein